MKTIGEILKTARASKKMSFQKLEEKTKIKSDFIKALENEEWNNLPAFPTVLGFVKSLAAQLGVDVKGAVAVLRRDYPRKSEAVSPKPDTINKFVWSPKLTFFVGIGIVLASVFGYLIFQYAGFVSPPTLNVETPKEGETVDGKYVVVSGTTDLDAKIIVNNQPVIVDENGKFLIGLEIVPETKEIEIKASSRSGKETIIKRNITVKSK